MYLINRSTNTLQPLNKKSFNEIGFKERQHLQEWLASNPQCLGEKLLIIQKEFNGFLETYERLDLLAIDRKGNLVIIENKLDDSGRDVTWQALKYASYCSTLTKEQIRGIFQSYLDTQSTSKNAVELLTEFFDGVEYNDIVLNQGMTQRIILVAANFRKEVTSTVLWLINFKVQLQCFKTTLYELNNEFFLAIEQIIPTKDAQEYIISMANKVQEEYSTEEDVKTRHRLRLEFWNILLNKIRGKSSLFQSSNPTKDHWLVAGGTNIAGVSYQFIITMSSASVSLNFARPIMEENKVMFDALFAEKEKVEQSFGNTLKWERLDEYKSSKITYTLDGVNYYLKEDWDRIIEFLIVHINRLEAAIRPFIPEIKKNLISRESESAEE